MKKKNKKIKYNIQLEVMKKIVKSLNWTGAFMRFPYYNHKGLLKNADVTFRVKWNGK